MTDIYMLAHQDDEGTYPIAPFTTLEKAQEYAQKQHRDELEGNDLGIDPDEWELFWAYSADFPWWHEGDREEWITDEGEFGWYTIRKTILDPEPGTPV
jgi:hypothetical protein